MSSSTDSSTSPVTKNEVKGSKRSAVDFSTVARRVTSRTTDLIAIGVVLIGGLTMGRQIVEWWRDEPPSVGMAGPADASTLPWGAGDAPVVLEFGDYPLALRRQTVTGDREAAIAALIEECRASAESARPKDVPSGPAVERLLDHTSSLTPVAESPGAWQVYRLEDRFSLVLGIRLAKGDDAPEKTETRRLVCWGLAAPFNDTTWTLYLFQPTTAGGTPVVNALEIPLPPLGRRLLAVRGRDGGGLIGFSGEGLPQEWMAFFDERLKSEGWSQGRGWTSSPGGWSARYESASGFPTSSEDSDKSNAIAREPIGDTKRSFESGVPKQSLGTRGKAQVAIEFSRDAAGGLTGLIQIVP